MKLTIIGCGDAFGSGGRLQTGYQVEWAGRRFMIDCGATVLIGLNRLALDPNAIDTIFISHLHGDHYVGLVWWLIHAQHVGQRTQPLTVVGPPGIGARYVNATEALYPGSSSVERRYQLKFIELSPTAPADLGRLRVTAFEVSHPSGAPSFALRFQLGDKVLAFSGDSEWVENLVPAGRDADLYIMECYHFDGAPGFHMSWRKLAAELDRIGAKRVLLTHMGDSMLARRGDIHDPRVLLAEDGLTVEL